MKVAETTQEVPRPVSPEPEPTASPSWRAPGLDWAAGGITVALYLVGQLLFLQGPHPFDPSWYFYTAIDFPDVEPDLFTLRIGLLGPVHAAILAFGPSEAALYAVPLLSGVLLVASVFATMLLFFHDRVLAAVAA